MNHWEMIEAGEAVDRLTEKEALVIAPNMGDTTLLFQTNRKGWPIGSGIEEKRLLGATYYVTINRDDEYNELLQTYSILEETDRYSIIDLRELKDVQ